MKVAALAFTMFFTLIGCATRGYQGPPRSPAELATVYFYSQGRLSLQRMTVNGTDQGVFDMGVTVPAGPVTASADYQLAVHECPMYSWNCFDEVLYGRCEFTLNTAGGKEYGIELRGAGESVWNRVYDKSTDEIAGSGTCVNERDDYHNSIWRRRSTIGR